MQRGLPGEVFVNIASGMLFLSRPAPVGAEREDWVVKILLQNAGREGSSHISV
jgi:hypothetical protein